MESAHIAFTDRMLLRPRQSYTFSAMDVDYEPTQEFPTIVCGCTDGSISCYRKADLELSHRPELVKGQIKRLRYLGIVDHIIALASSETKVIVNESPRQILHTDSEDCIAFDVATRPAPESVIPYVSIFQLTKRRILIWIATPDSASPTCPQPYNLVGSLQISDFSDDCRNIYALSATSCLVVASGQRYLHISFPTEWIFPGNPEGLPRHEVLPGASLLRVSPRYPAPDQLRAVVIESIIAPRIDNPKLPVCDMGTEILALVGETSAPGTRRPMFRTFTLDRSTAAATSRRETQLKLDEKVFDLAYCAPYLVTLVQSSEDPIRIYDTAGWYTQGFPFSKQPIQLAVPHHDGNRVVYVLTPKELHMLTLEPLLTQVREYCVDKWFDRALALLRRVPDEDFFMAGTNREREMEGTAIKQALYNLEEGHDPSLAMVEFSEINIHPVEVLRKIGWSSLIGESFVGTVEPRLGPALERSEEERPEPNAYLLKVRRNELDAYNELTSKPRLTHAQEARLRTVLQRLQATDTAQLLYYMHKAPDYLSTFVKQQPNFVLVEDVASRLTRENRLKELCELLFHRGEHAAVLQRLLDLFAADKQERSFTEGLSAEERLSDQQQVILSHLTSYIRRFPPESYADNKPLFFQSLHLLATYDPFLFECAMSSIHVIKTSRPGRINVSECDELMKYLRVQPNGDEAYGQFLEHLVYDCKVVSGKIHNELCKWYLAQVAKELREWPTMHDDLHAALQLRQRRLAARAADTAKITHEHSACDPALVRQRPDFAQIDEAPDTPELTEMMASQSHISSGFGDELPALPLPHCSEGLPPHISLESVLADLHQREVPAGCEGGLLGSYRFRLLQFITNSDYLEAVTVYTSAKTLPQPEGAALLLRLGNNPGKAFEDLVNRNSLLPLAIDLAIRQTQQAPHDKEANTDLWMSLITVLLNHVDWSRRLCSDERLKVFIVLGILKQQALSIDCVRALSELHHEIPIVELKEFISSLLIGLTNQQRRILMKYKLLKSENLRLDHILAKKRRTQYFVVEETSCCDVCHDSIHGSEFVRKPDGTLTHKLCDSSK